MPELKGHCACGAVHYEIRGEPLATQACHCLDCQRTTGAAFVIHTIVCEPDFVISGETRMGLGPTGSAAGCELHACAVCGVLIWVRYRYHRVPVIAIRAGTLEEPSAVAPLAHIFTDRKLPWVPLPPDVPTYPGPIDRDRAWPADSIARYNALPPRA